MKKVERQKRKTKELIITKADLPPVASQEYG
jgi:hypothetical protein